MHPLPPQILKAKSKVCAIWGILEANLEKSSTLNIHDEYQFCTFNLHSQIHHLNFHRKKYACWFFSTDFRFHFHKNPRFRRIPGSDFRSKWVQYLNKKKFTSILFTDNWQIKWLEQRNMIAKLAQSQKAYQVTRQLTRSVGTQSNAIIATSLLVHLNHPCNFSLTPVEFKHLIHVPVLACFHLFAFALPDLCVSLWSCVCYPQHMIYESTSTFTLNVSFYHWR